MPTALSDAKWNNTWNDLLKILEINFKGLLQLTELSKKKLLSFNSKRGWQTGACKEWKFRKPAALRDKTYRRRRVVSTYKSLSTICTPLTHCASSPCLSLSAPCWALQLACDASPAPSDRWDQIQEQPDATLTLRAGVIVKDSSACLEGGGYFYIIFENFGNCLQEVEWDF